MSDKAIFVDRDHTLIEDPGYISTPDAVKLLPGVELAVKSLSQAGYKIIVVTNQSGVARGLLTEEALELIHAEMRKQLADRGAHINAIYYCPFHPEGTVEKYAIESELCKPKPGMLLKAAGEMDIDLAASWMVGDSSRDIEAGQRAGCRTVRVRTSSAPTPGEDGENGVQADFTVRNMVDAARVILRESISTAGPADESPATPPAAAKSPHDDALKSMSDRQLRVETLRCLRRIARMDSRADFSFARVAGAILLVLTLAILALAAVMLWRFGDVMQALLAAVTAVALQLMALTFFSIHRHR